MIGQSVWPRKLKHQTNRLPTIGAIRAPHPLTRCFTKDSGPSLLGGWGGLPAKPSKALTNTNQAPAILQACASCPLCTNACLPKPLPPLHRSAVASAFPFPMKTTRFHLDILSPLECGCVSFRRSPKMDVVFPFGFPESNP